MQSSSSLALSIMKESEVHFDPLVNLPNVKKKFTDLTENEWSCIKAFFENKFTEEQILFLLENYRKNLEDMTTFLRCNTCTHFEGFKLQMPIFNDPQFKTLLVSIAAILSNEVHSNKEKEAKTTSFCGSPLQMGMLIPYLLRLMSNCFVEPSYETIEDTFIKALINLNRYCAHSGDFLHQKNILSLLGVAVMVSCKMDNDKFYKNRVMAKIFRLSTDLVRTLEVNFLNGLDHKLFLDLENQESNEEYQKMRLGLKLCLHHAYSQFVLRSQNPSELKHTAETSVKSSGSSLKRKPEEDQTQKADLDEPALKKRRLAPK